MPFSADLSADIAALIVSNTAVSAFSSGNRYVALHSGNPGDDCAANELSGDGYARTLTTFESIAGPSGPMVRNNQIVVFPAATGTKGGQITYFSVWDTDSGGSPIGYGALTAPANWTSGVSLSLAVNALVMTVVDK